MAARDTPCFRAVSRIATRATLIRGRAIMMPRRHGMAILELSFTNERDGPT